MGGSNQGGEGNPRFEPRLGITCNAECLSLIRREVTKQSYDWPSNENPVTIPAVTVSSTIHLAPMIENSQLVSRRYCSERIRVRQVCANILLKICHRGKSAAFSQWHHHVNYANRFVLHIICLESEPTQFNPRTWNLLCRSAIAT